MNPIRYAKIGYVALDVTDLARSVAFYERLVGLNLTATDGVEQAFLRCSVDHHNLILHRAPQPGLRRVGWELQSVEMVSAAFDFLEQAGLAPCWLSDAASRNLAQGPTFRVREPNSTLTLEYYAQMTEMAMPFVPTVTHIERLGHVVITVKEFDKTLQTLADRLNFRVSDLSPGNLAFLRCFPNPYHPALAIQRGGKDALNHVNFMVRDIDDIGRAASRMRAHGVQIVFGPGRHKPSGSIFLYFLDPDGMMAELSFGMEEFPENDARKPHILEASPLTLDLWGSHPLPGFGGTGHIVAGED